MYGVKWTYDEGLKAYTLYKEGKSIPEIGVILNRSRDAVAYKMSSKGLYYHPPKEL